MSDNENNVRSPVAEKGMSDVIDVLHKWKIYNGIGQYILHNSIKDINFKDKIIHFMIDKIISIDDTNTINYITLNETNIKNSSNVNVLYITNLLFGMDTQITAKYIIIDTLGMNILQLRNIENRLKGKYIFMFSYYEEDLRFIIKVPIMNREEPEINFEVKEIILNDNERNELTECDTFIDNEITKFTIDDKDLVNLEGISNIFTLINACSRGFRAYIKGKFINNEPSYYRRYLAELMGWSPTLDTNIPYFNDIHKNFNPARIGEVSNIIMNVMRKRTDILKHSISKVKEVCNIVADNINKKIIVFAADYKNAELIGQELNKLNISNRVIHNSLKGVPLYDDMGNPIRYKSGTNKGEIKLHGVKSVKDAYSSDFLHNRVNVLIIADKINTKLVLGKIDLIVINNLSIDYKNVFNNSLFKLPDNYIINVLIIYTNSNRDYNKLKSLLFENNKSNILKRGITKQLK